MSRFFLMASLLTLILCSVIFSKCLFLLAIVFGVSALMSRVIAAVAAYALDAVSFVIWPPRPTSLPVTSLLIHQEKIPYTNSIPLPGIPRFVLHH